MTLRRFSLLPFIYKLESHIFYKIAGRKPKSGKTFNLTEEKRQLKFGKDF